MSITNTYTVKISVKEAKKNVDDINMSLQQQEDLLKDIQREIEKIEDKRAKADPKDRNRIKQYNEKLKLRKILHQTQQTVTRISATSSLNARMRIIFLAASRAALNVLDFFTYEFVTPVAHFHANGVSQRAGPAGRSDAARRSSADDATRT